MRRASAKPPARAQDPSRRPSHPATTTTTTTTDEGDARGGVRTRAQAAMAASPPARASRTRRATRQPRGDSPTDTSAATAALPEEAYSEDVSSARSQPCDTDGTDSLSDEAIAAALGQRLVDYRTAQEEGCKLRERATTSVGLAAAVAESRSPADRGVPAVRLVVGGEAFTVPVHTLLGREPGTYFHALLHVQHARDGDWQNGRSSSDYYSEDAGGPPTAQRRRTETETAAPPPSAEVGAASAAWGSMRDPAWAVRPLAKSDDRWAAAAFPAEVFTDGTGAIFLDRDPATFRHILNYLRGYRRFHMLDGEELSKLRVDADYFQLRGLRDLISETDANVELQFKTGPGVNVERNRFRGVYSVATVGDAFMVTGQHSITFQVLATEYVGVGLVSEAFVNQDAEFHKTANCAVYYMSGVFYTNFPNYRKEEGLAKFEAGDYVTLSVNMDKGHAEVVVKHATKMFSLGRARRLKFAVTLKLGSQVRIVPPEEAAEVARRLLTAEAEEAARSPAASPAVHEDREPAREAVEAVTGIVVATVAPPSQLLGHARPPAPTGTTLVGDEAVEEAEEAELEGEYGGDNDEGEGDPEEGEEEEEGEYFDE